jgi:hypothetical protein
MSREEEEGYMGMGIFVDEERVELLTTIIRTLTTCGGTKLTTILTSYTVVVYLLYSDALALMLFLYCTVVVSLLYSYV